MSKSFYQRERFNQIPELHCGVNPMFNDQLHDLHTVEPGLSAGQGGGFADLR